MHKIHIAIFCSFIVILAACSKNNAPATLPGNSVSIQTVADKDTVQMAVALASDTTLVLGLKAVLSAPSATDHWVTFAADTTKLAAFKQKYGSAVLLPASAYFFYKPTTRIPAGASVSDSAQVNIVLQTKLEGYTTYVLPVVIQSVDGNVDGLAKSQTFYYVLKTGKPSTISKTGWTIAGYSSAYSTSSASYPATNVLDDNNTTTYWVSDLTQTMPQWVAISFNKSVTFTGVTYYFPTAYTYPTKGGYPTSIKIETSTDGSSWDNKGVFTGNIVSNMQTLPVPETTAKYLRFTALSSVKYSSSYECIFISGISLVP